MDIPLQGKAAWEEKKGHRSIDLWRVRKKICKMASMVPN